MIYIKFCTINKGCQVTIESGYVKSKHGFFMNVIVDDKEINGTKRIAMHPLEDARGVIYRSDEDPNFINQKGISPVFNPFIEKLKALDIVIDHCFIQQLIDIKPEGNVEIAQTL